MASLPQPTKSRLRYFSIDGVPLRQHTFAISAYETIFKPYLQATAIVLDKNQVMSNAKFRKGVPCSFAFDCGGRVYEQTLRLYSLVGEQNTDSKRASRVTVQMIGESFFKDHQNLVQQSFQNETGTQAIRSIHSQFIGEGLRILDESIGPIAKEAHISSAISPFKAITNIAERLNYARYQTGNTMYFRDRDSFVLAPLEALFDQKGSQQTFLEKATWGADWKDIFEAYNMVISAEAFVDFAKTGSLGAQKTAKNANQEQNVFDIRTKKSVIKKMVSAITGGFPSNLGLGGGNAGGHGGRPNYEVMNTSNLMKSVDRSLKTLKENYYSAVFSEGPMWTIKVPLNSGINCTVGKGITAHLLPPIGDMSKGTNHIGGDMLVTDLCHTVKNDGQQATGTTTMQCAKGQYS